MSCQLCLSGALAIRIRSTKQDSNHERVSAFDRGGIERVLNGTVNGKPVYKYQIPCNRCGGAEKWRHTGWTCFKCGGSRLGPVRTANLYTAERLQKLNEAAQKRQAKAASAALAKAAAIAAERDARRAAFLIDNADLLKKLRSIPGEFWDKLYTDMIERATPPSKRQVEIIEAEVARMAIRAGSQFVGRTGERIVLTVKTEKVIDITPAEQRYGFGPRYMFLARDAAGNRIVYRGNGDFPGEGESATLKATVAEHAEYRGERRLSCSARGSLIPRGAKARVPN